MNPCLNRDTIVSPILLTVHNSTRIRIAPMLDLTPTLTTQPSQGCHADEAKKASHMQTLSERVAELQLANGELRLGVEEEHGRRASLQAPWPIPPCHRLSLQVHASDLSPIR